MVRRNHDVGELMTLLKTRLYAYNLTSKARDAGKDFDTLIAAGNGSPQGLWSDGTTMWVTVDQL